MHVGTALLSDTHITNNFQLVDGLIEVWPIKSNGDEGRWQLQGDTVMERIGKGTVKASPKNDGSWIIQYLNEGALKEIANGTLVLVGRDQNGAMIVERKSSKSVAAKSIWNKVSHDATAHGTNLIAKIIGGSRFSFPKSLYAVQDTIAVLIDERYYMEFVDALDKHPEIETVYIVTDSEAGYRDMIVGMEDKNTYQLYRDYLDNFRINSVRR